MIPQSQWRAWAKPAYRALRDAGPDGLTRIQLISAAGLETGERVADVMWWLRSKGVDIVYRLGPEGGRYVLEVPMPPAWDV